MQISSQVGKWLGIIGIICGAVAFFWQPVVMGIISIILGVIGLFSDQKALNVVAIIVGAVALLVHYLA